MLIWIIVILACIGLDQLTKALAVKLLAPDGEFIIIKDVFRFRYIENDGMAFGKLDGENERWIFMVVSVIGILALLFYLWKYRPESKFACTALAMIIGGGIGNMIDRTFYNALWPSHEGKKVVVDFIDFYAFPDLWNAVFNVADSFVCIGAGMLILWCIIEIIKETKLEKEKKALLAQRAAEEAGEDSVTDEPPSDN